MVVVAVDVVGVLVVGKFVADNFVDKKTAIVDNLEDMPIADTGKLVENAVVDNFGHMVAVDKLLEMEGVDNIVEGVDDIVGDLDSVIVDSLLLAVLKKSFVCVREAIGLRQDQQLARICRRKHHPGHNRTLLVQGHQFLGPVAYCCFDLL